MKNVRWKINFQNPTEEPSDIRNIFRIDFTQEFIYNPNPNYLNKQIFSNCCSNSSNSVASPTCNSSKTTKSSNKKNRSRDHHHDNKLHKAETKIKLKEENVEPKRNTESTYFSIIAIDMQESTFL